MIILTVLFLRKLGTLTKTLSARGFEELTINVADGKLARLTRYSEFEIGVLGVGQKIEAFFRLFSSSNVEDVYLLLGMPWLHAVYAKMRIRDSRIKIGVHKKVNQ